MFHLKLLRTELLSSLWTCVSRRIRLEMMYLSPQVNGDPSSSNTSALPLTKQDMILNRKNSSEPISHTKRSFSKKEDQIENDIKFTIRPTKTQNHSITSRHDVQFQVKWRSLDCDCLKSSWLAVLFAKNSVKMLAPKPRFSARNRSHCWESFSLGININIYIYTKYLIIYMCIYILFIH